MHWEASGLKNPTTTCCGRGQSFIQIQNQGRLGFQRPSGREKRPGGSGGSSMLQHAWALASRPGSKAVRQGWQRSQETQSIPHLLWQLLPRKLLRQHPEVLCNCPARPNQWCHHPMTELARPAESPERSSSAKDSAGQSHETLESPPLDRMWPLCSACKVGQQYKSRKAVQKALRDSCRQPSHWSCALPPKIIVSCRHVVTVTQRQDLEKYQDAGRVGRQRQDLPEAVWRKVGSSLCRWRRRHSTRASSPPHGHGRRCGK